MKCFGVVGRVTSNKRLDFDDDQDHDPGPGIFFYRNFYQVVRDMGQSAVVRLLRDQLPCWSYAISECF